MRKADMFPVSSKSARSKPSRVGCSRVADVGQFPTKAVIKMRGDLCWAADSSK